LLPVDYLHLFQACFGKASAGNACSCRAVSIRFRISYVNQTIFREARIHRNIETTLPPG
jgi:hypothetical protein